MNDGDDGPWIGVEPVKQQVSGLSIHCVQDQVAREGVATVNEPTPDEAAAALRAAGDGRERVIKSAVGSRSVSIAAGLLVILYGVADDLFPPARSWLGWPLVAVVLVLAFSLRTRVGSALLGRRVMVSSQLLLCTAPILGIALAVALIIMLFQVPHGEIYYCALAGLYIIFVGPGFQLWLLRLQGRD
jgi:hypothetical protein